MNLTLKKLSLPFVIGAATLTSSLAIAAPGETSDIIRKSDSETVFTVGNTNAGGRMYSYAYKYNSHNGANGYQHRNTTLDIDAYLFKKSVKLLDSSARSKYWRTASSTTNQLEGSVKIAGVTIIAPSESTLADGTKTRSSGMKSFNKEFFSASASYPIGPVKLTVSGSANGSLSTSLEASQRSTNYNTYTSDYGRAYTYARSKIIGTGKVTAGIPWLASASITTTTELVDAWVTNNAWGYRFDIFGATAGSEIYYSGGIDGDSGVSVGSGNVKLKLKTIGITAYTNTLASWNGYSVASKNLYDDQFSEFFSK